MVDAIIVAAGLGKRMNMQKNKQLLKIFDKPVFIWSIEAFKTECIDRINLVIRKEDEEEIEYYLKKYKLNVDIFYGGNERQDSIYNCIKHLKNSDYVLIHDGARPFISKDIIKRCVCMLEKNKAICVGMPVKDTIKIVDENNNIEFTPDRKSIWMAQTPQCFEYEIVKNAYERAYEKNLYFTDDSSLVQETIGIHSVMVSGDYKNIKITTPEDISIANSIAKIIKEELST